MTIAPSLIAYMVAAAVLTLTPGFDTVLVLRTATMEGAGKATLAALGVGAGCLVWGASAAFGLGALLAASQLAYDVLKWLGAAYLAWLGLGLIVWPRTAIAAAPLDISPGGKPSRSTWFRKGLLGNLLNPKVGVFYISFLPQFIPAGVEVAAYTLLLAAIHVALGLLWSAALIGASRSLGSALRRPNFVMALDRLAGCIFLGFGVRLALSGR